MYIVFFLILSIVAGNISAHLLLAAPASLRLFDLFTRFHLGYFFFFSFFVCVCVSPLCREEDLDIFERKCAGILKKSANK